MPNDKPIQPVVLHLPDFYGKIGIGSIIFGGLISVDTLFNEGIEGMLLSLPVFGFFALLGALLVAGRRVMKVKVYDTKIVKVSFIGTSKEIQFANIREVKFNRSTLELKLRDGSKRIKCHAHLVGFERIIAKLEEYNIDISHLYKATRP